ncbi:MAG: hypothetical protein AB7F86_05460 [Bdellovibrionales bacterium]
MKFCLSITLILIFVATGCGPRMRYMKDYQYLLKSNACEAEFKSVFEGTYYPFVRKIGCHNCHAAGGAKSDTPFAHSDPGLALQAFLKINPDQLQTRLVEGHKQSELGYSYTAQMEGELNTYKIEWLAAVNRCKPSALALISSTLNSDLFDSSSLRDLSKCGLGDPLDSSYSTKGILHFDLGQVRPELEGVMISLHIKPNQISNIGGNSCSHQGYRAGDVRITTPKALRIHNLSIRLNGQSFGVNTFLVTREIPAGSKDYQLIESSGGAYGLFDSGSSKQADEWSLFFEEIRIVN